MPAKNTKTKKGEVQPEEKPVKVLAKKKAPLRKKVLKTKEAAKKEVLAENQISAAEKKNAGDDSGKKKNKTIAKASKTKKRGEEIQSQETGGEKHFVKWTEKDFVRTGDEVFFYSVSLIASVIAIFWA